jgi:hypothetical protein
MGAMADGTVESLAVADGFRESEQLLLEVVLDCKSRGLTSAPAVADG